MRALTMLEGRVLGVLVEKAHTVPDSYPLSLNALTLGANQKTARDPVTAATEGEIREAIDGLRSLHLVFDASGSRVSRYEHNMARGLALPSQSVALLAALLLRGPQTTSELRANAERLYRFADVSSVEGFLDELATRSEDKGGALVVKMARAPGAREARWVHLLCGAFSGVLISHELDTTEAERTMTRDDVGTAALTELQAQHATLTARVDALSDRVDRLLHDLEAFRQIDGEPPSR